MAKLQGTSLGINNPSNISEAGTTVSDIQYYSTSGIYASSADKAFATYELSELKYLPKSLFYDAATSDGVYRGLFSYYVLGGSKDRVRYDLSETKDYLQKITPRESKNPTAKQIMDVINGAGPSGIPSYLDPQSPYRGQIYNVKDFIFCKYYGIIPNNRMLTLRRFAYPTLDSLRVLASDKVGDFSVAAGANNVNQVSYKNFEIKDLGRLQDVKGIYNTSLPVAQLVTYFGGDTKNNLNSILGIDTGLNFTLQTQEPVKTENTGDPGLMNTPYGDLIKAAITSGDNQISETDLESLDKLAATLISPEKQINILQRSLLDAAVSAEGPLSKKIFVNVNTVNQVNTRAQGFNGGTNSFTLNFDFTLNSAGQVNSKLLFLDLMTNVFSVATDYGQFLTPEIRIQQTNLGLGFPGGPGKYAMSITDPINYVRDVVSRMLSKSEVDRQLNAEKSLTEEMTQLANEMKEFVYNPDQGLTPDKKLYKSIAVMISDAFLKKVYFSPIMLSGYPTGDWHLTIGNPLNPIAMMGNLVCKNVKIGFNDELGPDDFPTEMNVQITLEPGRQRHRGDWESMFNRGNGRLYLGQLVKSQESTNAWVNVSTGQFVNQTDGQDIYDITRNNIDPLTGTETNATIGESQQGN